MSFKGTGGSHLFLFSFDITYRLSLTDAISVDGDYSALCQTASSPNGPERLEMSYGNPALYREATENHAIRMKGSRWVLFELHKFGAVEKGNPCVYGPRTPH